MSKTNTKHIDRRALLKSASIATAATTLATLPALAGAQADQALIGATPEVVALADRVLSGIAAYCAAAEGLANFVDDPECEPISDRYHEAWSALARFPSRNAADIAQKLRAAETFYEGSDKSELCEMLFADCRRVLAGKGGAA